MTALACGIPGRSLLLFLCLLWTAAVGASTGCSAPFSGLKEDLAEHGHYIEGVPFVEQQDNFCGPAALAVVLSFWGSPRSPQEIAAAVYLPELSGTLPMDMVRYLRAQGFSAADRNGTTGEVRSAVRRGLPVVVLLDSGIGRYRRPHYVTVIGFDDRTRIFIVHDGRTANRTIGYDAFLRQWGRGGSWMLLAVPERRH